MGLPVLTGSETATIEQAEMQTTSTKKAPEGANFKNGGNDEARTRDLMRDRGFLKHKNAVFATFLALCNFSKTA